MPTYDLVPPNSCLMVDKFKNVKMTFADFDISHRLASLRKLYDLKLLFIGKN